LCLAERAKRIKQSEIITGEIREKKGRANTL
jgi:hypothetical protein